MPGEAVLEEVQIYPTSGRPRVRGVRWLHRGEGSIAGAPRDGLWAVRHGEIIVVADGYHPFVATTGENAYYPNALAGDRPSMASSVDPDLDYVLGGNARLAGPAGDSRAAPTRESPPGRRPREAACGR